MKVGERVKQVRESMGISLSDCARRCGITRQRLFQIEEVQSSRNPQIATLFMVAKGLHCTIDYLLIGTDYDVSAFAGESPFTCKNADKCMFFQKKE